MTQYGQTIATIADITRRGTELRFILTSFNGGPEKIDMRIWYEDEDGEMRPSKQGFRVKADKFPLFADAVEEAASELPK